MSEAERHARRFLLKSTLLANVILIGLMIGVGALLESVEVVLITVVFVPIFSGLLSLKVYRDWKADREENGE